MTDRTLSAGDGFMVEVLHIYARGPNDPPGNQRIYICDDCRRSRAQGHAEGCPNIPKPQPVAAPTTLSAAELDELEKLRYLLPTEHAKVFSQARRTEAAERENKSLKAALDSNSGELLPALAVAIHRAETAERKVAKCEALCDAVLNLPNYDAVDYGVHEGRRDMADSIRRALAED